MQILRGRESQPSAPEIKDEEGDNAAKVKGHLMTSDKSEPCSEKVLSTGEESGMSNGGNGCGCFRAQRSTHAHRTQITVIYPVVSSSDES